jgi:chorismate mutase
MPVRGIRGATVVAADEREQILEATMRLLEDMTTANEVDVDDVASIMFTMTPDLRSAYPARAARLLGWTNAPLLGAVETDVDGGLPRCIRVMMLVNTQKPAAKITHVYLGKAATLRPDR